MKKIENTDQARAAVVRSMKRRRPITISYTRTNGSKTTRTVEPYMLTRSTAGDPYMRAMDRKSGQSRTWRLDRISAVTEHRILFAVSRPGPVSDAGRITAARMTEIGTEAAPWLRVHGAPVRRSGVVQDTTAVGRFEMRSS